MDADRRKIDVLLVRLPPADGSAPPLALATLAGAVERAGFCAKGLDLARPRFAALPGDELLALVAAENVDAVVLWAESTSSAALVRAIGESAARRAVLLAGPAARADEARAWLAARLVDFLLVGEIEETVVEILRRRSLGQSLAFLRGARWIDAGGEARFKPREPRRDLETGLPDFRPFPPADYPDGTLPIRLSRGCPRRCAFCGEQPAAGPFRVRQPADVIAELRAQQQRWGVARFRFEDLILNGDLAALDDLCRLLAAEAAPALWSAQLAPDAALTAERFAAMAAAGCRTVRFGIESFADELLARMNKPYDGATARRNLVDAHAAGLETRVNLLVGFPGERDADFLATARALWELRDAIAAVDELRPCEAPPGSLLERECASFGVLIPEAGGRGAWSHRGYNNPAWRRKRAAEMAIWVAGLGVQFAFDAHLPPTHELRALTAKIRERLARKIAPPADVVLVGLPPWGWENPPVALACLSSYLRAHGCGTIVLDYNIKFYRAVHEIYHPLWHVENKNFWSNDDTFEAVKYSLRGQLDEAIDELVRLSPPVLGISVVDPKERLAIEFIRRFREHNRTTRIILGGPACFTPEYRQIFIDRAGALIDGYCIGEGEPTLLEVVRRTRAGESLHGVPGLMTLDARGECQFTPRPPIMDLDSLAPPTYDEFDLSQYPGDSLILEWSRGCIGNCVYCKGREITGAFRMRSAAHIVAELRRHVERHGLRRFTIADNLLNGDPAILEEVCDRLLAAKLDIRWNGEALPLPSMSRALLDKMARAGCTEIQWGLESAAPDVLRRMGKARFFAADEAARVVRDCHEAGVKTCLFIIVGFPGETAEDFAQTLEFVRANAAWIDQVKSINAMHVITGTALQLHPERFGIELPAENYHYLWRSRDGANTPAERNRRIRELLTLCQGLGVEVRETNLTEGKQEDVAARFREPGLSLEAKMKLLIDATHDLRSFETATVEAGDRAGPLACSSCGGDEAFDEAAFVRANRALAGVLDGQRTFAGPEILEIDLTNFCNLDCVGCWNHSPLLGDARFAGEEKQRRLPTELVLKLIDDAAAMGAKQVQLSGAGDPLCHPDALAVIERVKSHGLACTLITNGTLLTDRVGARLVELGLDDLTVSVWAGTPQVYAAVHPNQPPKTLAAIRQSLQRIHALKAERRVFAPKVKVYHVVCHPNAEDIGPMIDFAVEALADFVEFTPIDVVPGRTDQLALTAADRASIARQLNDLPKRADYLELDPTRGGRRADADGEGLEFARFVKQSILPKGFRYELDDITRFDVLCPRKEWRLDVREDNEVENALLFFYPKQECENCPNRPTCAIDQERWMVKVEFTSFLGYGAFLRRIQSGAGGYDADAVERTPCSIGWTYARVKTDGAVIPCCKADRLPLGNLHERAFAEIWDGPSYAEFRRTALTTSKRDPYFAPIDCHAACDNLGHNLETARRLAALDELKRSVLRRLAAR